MAFKFEPPPINVYASMVAYPETSKDKNQGTQLRSKEEKTSLVISTFNKYFGQTIPLVHLKRGEVRFVEVRGVQGRNWINHMLFGEWRFATQADVDASQKKERAEAERLACRLATQEAIKAGAIFKSTAGAAAAVMRFNELQAKDGTQIETMPAEPTEADLDALQAKIDAARKAKAKTKEKK